MTNSLADTLNQLDADPDTVQQGLRLFLAEQTGDLTPREMLAELQAAADPAEIQRFVDQFKADSEALDQAALSAFEGAWSDPDARPAIQQALAHAKDKLPVIELGIVAIVAMYGMYRAIPAQPIRKTIRRGKDAKGNRYEAIIEEQEPFLPILSAFSKLFTKSKSAKG
jgi:hypothetical protein